MWVQGGRTRTAVRRRNRQRLSQPRWYARCASLPNTARVVSAPTECDLASLAGNLHPRATGRDYHKRSHAEAHPLTDEGEVRGRKRRKDSKRAAKMRQPGCLVFLAHDLRAPGGPYSLHPHVIVSSGPQRLQGMRQPANCVVVQPIVVQTEGAPPAAAAPLERTLPASEVVGLAIDFKGIWQEHVTPGLPLEKAMLQAIDLMRQRCEPPRSFLVMWNEVAPGLPVALFHQSE